MKNILIIDDLKGDLLLIKNIIETNIEDANVITANNGILGLQIAKSHLPDAIILDIFMPGIDGYEVARKLRNNKVTKNIPIVMLTGNLESINAMEKGLQAGANIFLYKPINRIELIAQLNAILRMKSAEEKLEKENRKLLLKTEELERSKAAYKKLLFDLPVALAIHTDRIITYINPTGVKLIGAKSHIDVIGQPITNFIHPDFLNKEIENLKKLFSDQIRFMRVESMFINLYGKPIPVNVTAKKIYFNNKLSVQLVVEDISEQKKAETERERLLNQLQISEQLSKSGSWRYNIIKNKISLSDNLLKLHELHKNEFDNKPETLFSFIHPDDRQKITDNTNEILSKGQISTNNTIEYRIITARKNEITVVGSTIPITDSNGKVIEMVGSVRDITKEKKAAKKLKESEERFGITFELNPDPITITEIPTGKYVTVNHAFETETGYTKEEIIGKTTTEFGLWVNANDRKNLYDLLKNNNGELKGFETIFKTKSGEKVSSLLSAKVIKIDDKQYLLSIVKNIQKLNDNKSIIENERKTLRTYIDIAQVIIVVLDTNGNVAMINKKGCEVLGYNKNDILGKNWFNTFIPKKNLTRVKKVFNNLLKKEIKITEFHDNPIINSKGEERLIAWHNAIITNEKGIITGVLSSGDDVTDIRLQERELFEAKEKAMESDRLKSAFLANMSHEIRTPMNAILGFAQLLKEPDYSEKERLGFLNIILNSGNSLLELINDIIDVSTIEAGQLQLNLNKVNINKINNDIYDMFSLQAKDKNIELKLINTLSDEEAIVITDGLKLKQVLINIVGNAMKFTSEGYVKFGYEVKNNILNYYIEDTGIGIAKKDQPYVFDRFRKIENIKNQQYKGTGLGLSISKAYIEHIGGQLFLTSEINKGTTFYFTLPFKNPKQSSLNKNINTMKKRQYAGSLTGKKLLIAEDDLYVVKFLEMALKPLKLNLLFVNNGKEAIETVKHDREIAMILMDIKMPLINGHEATRIIKKFRPELPIVAQTAFALSGDEEKAIESGCDDYIAKPINRKRLIALIEKFMLSK